MTTKEKAIEILANIPFGVVSYYGESFWEFKMSVNEWLIGMSVMNDIDFDSPFEVLDDNDLVEFFLNRGVNLRYDLKKDEYFISGRSACSTKGELLVM